MNKKVLVIVGLAAAIAVGGGVYAVSNSADPKSGDTGSTATASSVSSYDEDVDVSSDSDDVITDDSQSVPDDIELPPDETDIPQENEPAEAPTGYDATVEPSVPYEEQIVSATMSVKFVVDSSTGAQADERVVFGKDYKLCYVKFNDDRSFEMCVDPASYKIRSGTYQIYGDVVSVEYDDGSGSEYDILTDEYGNITHVIVNYGEYNVYFGV